MLQMGEMKMKDNASKTIMFSLKDESEKEMHNILQSVYDSLKEKGLKVKGYNPINQLVGCIISEDPTYITNYNNARAQIRKIDRDELLRSLVKNYIKL